MQIFHIFLSKFRLDFVAACDHDYGNLTAYRAHVIDDQPTALTVHRSAAGWEAVGVIPASVCLSLCDFSLALLPNAVRTCHSSAFSITTERGKMLSCAGRAQRYDDLIQETRVLQKQISEV